MSFCGYHSRIWRSVNTLLKKTISHYFSNIKSLTNEISTLDLENDITETRMRRIIVHSLRPEYKSIITVTWGWATEPTLSVLENLLANVEDLEKPQLSLYIKDEDKTLFSKWQKLLKKNQGEKLTSRGRP